MHTSHFSQFISKQAAAGELVVQPRMGFGQWQQMRIGLRAVHDMAGPCIGTLTLDSYTRVGDYQSPTRCLARGEKLNGYPILTYPVFSTRALLEGLYGEDFPVQIRHGTALPNRVFQRMTEVGLDATEGGPVSYCLPYSRVPLADAIEAWAEACKQLAQRAPAAHIESFGGCLLGQLCPPSMLIVMGLLEARFFVACGIRSLSLSYAQGTSAKQDHAALRLLRALAEEFLPGIDWHVVCYTYMGVYPQTTLGALKLLKSSVRLSKAAGCERLIVKTKVESRQIPTIQDNVEALTLAIGEAKSVPQRSDLDPEEQAYYEEMQEEVRSILHSVLNLSSDINRAIGLGFERGLLDIPYCLHRDNTGLARSFIDARGALRWADPGNVALPRIIRGSQSKTKAVTSSDLLHMLYYVANQHDAEEIA